MLILKNIDQATAEGKWFEKDIWGQTCRFKIRPRTDEIIKNIRKKFKHIKNDKEREELILQDMVDYVLEDFEGFGSSPTQPLEVNRANKMRIWKIDVPVGEQPVSVWLLDRSNEMAIEVTEDEVKNSGRSLDGTTAQEENIS